MEKDAITFSVQMTEKEVYRYTLYHVYHSFSGVFGLCLSAIAIVNLVLNFNEMSDQIKTIMIIIALWSTVLDPLMMKSRCKSQFKRTKAYQKPLQYRIDVDGVTVSQDEASQTLAWDQLLRIVETKSQFLMYSSRVHAFVFPKSMMDGQESDMRCIVVHNTLDTNVRLKGKIKKLRNLVLKHKKIYEKTQQ